MTWLAWRQTRAQAYVVFVGLAVFAALTLLSHPHLVKLSGGATPLFDLLSPNDRRLYYAGVIALALVPAVLGAFLGAPLVARELEAGTHRLVWNQSITRRRWLAFRLAAVAALTALGVGLLSWTITWWSALLDGAQGERTGSLPSRMTPVAFSMRGLVPVGYVLLALSIAVAAGLVVRRTVPAMAISLALIAAVQIVMPLLVRPHLISPQTNVVTFDREHMDYIRNNPNDPELQIAMTAGTPGAWMISQHMVDSAGAITTTPGWFTQCLPTEDSTAAPPQEISNGSVKRIDGDSDPLDNCFSRLNSEGYRQVVVFHPAAHFWPLQWAETALLVLLAGVLTGFSFWWLSKEG